MSENSRAESFQTAQQLEAALSSAIEAPSPRSVKTFYQTFLNSNLLVPSRFQEKQATNVASFPSPFTDLLALSARDENYIPAFTSNEELATWSSEPLETLTLSGKQICERAPEGWWITLNPAGEIGKELSPWEVNLLKSGEEALEELTQEQLSGEIEAVSFRPLSEDQIERIFPKLTELLEIHEVISSVYGGLHSGEHSDERYIFGILHENQTLTEDQQAEVQTSLQQLFIGDLDVEMFFGHALDESPALALFRFSKPIIERNPSSQPKSLLSRLRNLLTQ